MSTITVVNKNGKICMAGETLTTFGHTKLDGEFQVEREKVMEWNDCLIGLVGSVSLIMIFKDIIHHRKEVPDFSSSINIYQFFTKLHQELKETYYVIPNEDRNDPVESSQFELVLANKHGIFGVHSLREVYHFSKFWAYGSGSDYALGAMQALYALESHDARQIAVNGVKAGVAFDSYSGGNITWKEVRTV